MCTGRKNMCIGRKNVCTGIGENSGKMYWCLLVVCFASFIFRSANEGSTKDNKQPINIRHNTDKIKMYKHKRLVKRIFDQHPR